MSDDHANDNWNNPHNHDKDHVFVTFNAIMACFY